MRLSNEVNTLKELLDEQEKANNITLDIEVFKTENSELQIYLIITHNDFKEYDYGSYELAVKNLTREFTKIELLNMDISNFEIKAISPIDHMQENEIYEYWNVEFEFDEFLSNRFFD